MKITATDADGVLTAIVLGDDAAGDVVIDPQPLPGESRAVQVTHLFRGERPFVTGRGNREITVAWVVARNHADLTTANGFVWGHAALVPINAVLLIEEGSTDKGFTGVITEVTALEHYGLATVFRYSITGAETAVPPS